MTCILMYLMVLCKFIAVLTVDLSLLTDVQNMHALYVT